MALLAGTVVDGWHVISKRKRLRYFPKFAEDYNSKPTNEVVYRPAYTLEEWNKCTKVYVGQDLHVNREKLELCKFGLHACRKLKDAMIYGAKYTPDAFYICQVRLSGTILDSTEGWKSNIWNMGDANKLCAERRRVIRMVGFDKVFNSYERSLISSRVPRSMRIENLTRIDFDKIEADIRAGVYD